MSDERCREKTRYPSRGKAEIALERIRKQGYRRPDAGKPKRAYYCDHCHGYHLTSYEKGY